MYSLQTLTLRMNREKRREGMMRFAYSRSFVEYSFNLPRVDPGGRYKSGGGVGVLDFRDFVR